MGLHQRHAHGRVLRGEAAREHLRQHKRYIQADNVRLHVPEGFDDNNKKEANNGGANTAVSVVYVTLPQTFSGAAVYSTLTGMRDPPSTADSANAATTDPAQASYDSAKSAAQGSHKKSSATVSTATVVPSTAAAMTTFATSSINPSIVVGAPLRATATSTSTPVPDQSQEGMTGGAKAGLAFGIIALIALVGGLIFFLWRKQQKSKSHQELLNEKHGSFADVSARRAEAGGHSPPTAAAAIINKRNSSMTEKVPTSIRSSRTASTAPRLSLRPVTQFLPNYLGENRKSNGNTLDPRSAANPFDDNRRNSPPANPFDEPERSPNEARAAAAGAAAGAATIAAAGGKSSYEGSEAGTPRSATFGAAAAGGPQSPRQPNNVHRVQLDFKPSMDDELELRSGQLVRLLHEYDDGWALCIRMDRSQQGVTPRTCLSKLPVKPRPNGPPPNQQGSRPGTAQSSHSQDSRRPANGSGAPNGGNGGIVPRPLTPGSANGRTPSPATQPAQQRSGDNPTSPIGVPARKPVPGQAM